LLVVSKTGSKCPNGSKQQHPTPPPSLAFPVANPFYPIIAPLGFWVSLPLQVRARAYVVASDYQKTSNNPNNPNNFSNNFSNNVPNLKLVTHST
jgi:hypothetical protein